MVETIKSEKKQKTLTFNLEVVTGKAEDLKDPEDLQLEEVKVLKDRR